MPGYSVKHTTAVQVADAGRESTWQDSAACAGMDDDRPNLFFPVGTSGPARDQIAKAKAVCRPCPVRVACLRWSEEAGAEFGVWGGLDEMERRLLRRGRAAQWAEAFK